MNFVNFLHRADDEAKWPAFHYAIPRDDAEENGVLTIRLVTITNNLAFANESLPWLLPFFSLRVEYLLVTLDLVDLAEEPARKRISQGKVELNRLIP